MTHDDGQTSISRHRMHQHVRTSSGESAPFHFDNVWRINARAPEVWSVLADVSSWPHWWPGLPVAEPDGDTVAPGSRAHIEVTSPIGLRLSFDIVLTETAPPGFVAFTADGDLRGMGEWVLEESGPITTVRSLWCVTTTRRSIRALRPIASLMHSHVMAAGRDGLARRLSSQA